MIQLALWKGFASFEKCNDLDKTLQEFQQNPENTSLVLLLLECVEGEDLSLSTLIVRRIKNKSDRDDFKQDLFFKACRSLARAKVTSNLEGYIYRLVNNTCTNFLKTPLAKPPNPIQDISEKDVKGFSKELDPDPFPDQDRQFLMAGLESKLKPQEFDTILKVYYDNKSYKEAAQEMGLSRDQFRGVIFRAVHKLREAYQDEYIMYLNSQ